MALIGINPVHPAPEKKDVMDRIVQGVQLAQGVLGLGLAIPEYLQKRASLKQQSAMEQERLQLEKDRLAASTTERQDDRLFREQQAKEERDWRSQESKLSRSLQLQIADMQRKIRDSEDNVKRLEEMRKREIPKLGQFAKDPKEADQINQAIEETSNILTNLDDLISQRESGRGGSMNLTRRGLAKQKARDIQLDLKSENFKQLGVLTGPDMSLLEQLMPSSPLEYTQSTLFGMDDPILANMRQLRTMLVTRMRTKLGARGIKIPGGMFDAPKTYIPDEGKFDPSKPYKIIGEV